MAVEANKRGSGVPGSGSSVGPVCLRVISLLTSRSFTLSVMPLGQVVVVYRLVTVNTVDERILTRAEEKRKLERVVIHKGACVLGCVCTGVFT